MASSSRKRDHMVESGDLHRHTALLCCALPALLVSLGLGAAVAGLTSELPWLVELSRHKEWVFAVSAIMLALAG